MGNIFACFILALNMFHYWPTACSKHITFTYRWEHEQYFYYCIIRIPILQYQYRLLRRVWTEETVSRLETIFTFPNSLWCNALFRDTKSHHVQFCNFSRHMFVGLIKIGNLKRHFLHRYQKTIIRVGTRYNLKNKYTTSKVLKYNRVIISILFIKTKSKLEWFLI